MHAILECYAIANAMLIKYVALISTSLNRLIL